MKVRPESGTIREGCITKASQGSVEGQVKVRPESGTIREGWIISQLGFSRRAGEGTSRIRYYKRRVNYKPARVQ